MIEKYLTSRNSNRWIDKLEDFVENYNSSYHSSIKKIPERLEIFDVVKVLPITTDWIVNQLREAIL
jgi:hypothetical protein